MITYTNKKTSFVITALLCDLFTSICMAAVHIFNCFYTCIHIDVHRVAWPDDFDKQITLV